MYILNTFPLQLFFFFVVQFNLYDIFLVIPHLICHYACVNMCRDQERGMLQVQVQVHLACKSLLYKLQVSNWNLLLTNTEVAISLFQWKIMQRKSRQWNDIWVVNEKKKTLKTQARALIAENNWKKTDREAKIVDPLFSLGESFWHSWFFLRLYAYIAH